LDKLGYSLVARSSWLAAGGSPANRSSLSLTASEVGGSEFKKHDRLER
jgi:hypothetical protein